MMCGCEARVAGGTTEKALASGGCGFEFDFVSKKTLQVILFLLFTIHHTLSFYVIQLY